MPDDEPFTMDGIKGHGRGAIVLVVDLDVDGWAHLGADGWLCAWADGMGLQGGKGPGLAAVKRMTRTTSA